MRLQYLAAPFIFALAACNQPAPPAESSAGEAMAAASTAAAAMPSAETPAAPSVEATAVKIEAPAGKYAIDRNHAMMAFQIDHLGLSNYVARFTDYSVSLDLDPADISASSVKVNIKAASIAADYPGDYKASHAKTGFESWAEDLAKSDKFFNSEKYPDITFESTSVEDAGDGSLEVVGDLTLLGKTQSVTLNVDVVGSAAAHPFTGAGAVGFSARGSFKRSGFGMTHLVDPPLVGDEVTLLFEGEFNQVPQDQAQ